MRSFFLVLLLLLSSVSFHFLAAVGGKPYVVVIDAGHGGKDFGAVRGEAKEKDINLGVALQLGKYIKENMANVHVVYTRKTDVFVELDQRSAIANKAKANLFISIHTNSTASETTTASGAETYILGLARSKENLEVAKRENSVILLEDDYSKRYEGFNPRSPESYIIFEFMTNKYMEQSYEMASYVQREFRKNTNQKDKGVRQAGFLVLRKSAMPSLLIEVGFVNNPKDCAYITSVSGQSELARAIYNAFKGFKREFDKKQGIAVASIADARENNADSDEKNDDTDNRGDSNVVRHTETSPRTGMGIPAGKVSVSSESKSDIEYKIQFYSSPKKLSRSSSSFKGLAPVDYYKEGKQYKYTYGSVPNIKDAIKLQKQVGEKFKDAFIVKFKNGEKVN